MTARDKRTLRIAAILVAAYLVIFYGVDLWRKGEKGRADYAQLLKKAQQLQQEKLAQENKALLFDKLSETYHLDPRKISKDTLVADASAAIQTAAQQSGVRLGPLRETPGRPNARELSTLLIEGNGPIAAALTLMHKIETLGYPLVIDSIQINQGGGGGGPGGPRGMPGMPPGMGGGGPPGQLKLNFTVVILNYDQWKTEAPHA
jgi:hypothetical protein